jgi:1,4-alpha-glucan branching enzyme
VSVRVRGRGRGALAIVLHTHMPYVEGFGTWPFGEEWLWEAIAGSYLPLLDVLEQGARLTLSMTPALCDQLEAPGLSERLENFLGVVRRETHERDGAGLRAAGETALAEEIELSRADYRRALERLRALDGDILGALAPFTTWTSSATHAILPLLATDAGVREQLHSGIASHHRRFGPDWQGGLWLPECAHEPRIERVLREEGVLASCVELTGRFGLGAPEHLHPILTGSGLTLFPVDRQTMSLVWSDDGYPAAAAYRDYHHHTVHHHNPWDNAGEPYRRAAAATLAAEHARDFVARTIARLDGAPGPPGLVVCALDTELLGHWWYEGIAWLRSVLEESERQGLELVTLDDARERFEPAHWADHPVWGASSWGQDGDLSTWSGPAVVELAFATRKAELELLAAGPVAGLAAIRELLALQSSDWAFMLSREIAAPYARERFAGHLAAFRRALAAGPDAGANGLRNLAIDASRAAFSAPS